MGIGELSYGFLAGDSFAVTWTKSSPRDNAPLGKCRELINYNRRDGPCRKTDSLPQISPGKMLHVLLYICRCKVPVKSGTSSPCLKNLLFIAIIDYNDHQQPFIIRICAVQQIPASGISRNKPLHPRTDEPAIMPKCPECFDRSNRTITGMQSHQIIAGIMISGTRFPAIPDLPCSSITLYEVVMNNFGQEQGTIHWAAGTLLPFFVTICQHRIFRLPVMQAIAGSGIRKVPANGNPVAVSFVSEITMTANDTRHMR